MLSQSEAKRELIRLDDNDLIAAAQVLSWIALPTRPLAGVELLESWFWARRAYRGEPVLETRLDVRRSRVEPKLAKFRLYLLRAFRAGIWFEQRVMSGPNRPEILSNYQISVRSLARRLIPHSRRYAESEGNVIRDVWSARKPVAHMAIAAGHQIAVEHAKQGTVGFNLEMALFNPVWIDAAVAEAESRARAAEMVGAFELSTLHKFCRDSF